MSSNPAESPQNLPCTDLILHFTWGREDGGQRMVESMLAFFGQVAEAIEVRRPRGWRQAENAVEAVRLLRQEAGLLRMRLPAGARIDIQSGPETEIRLSPSVLDEHPAERTWLQADPLLNSPVPILAVPLPDQRLPVDLVHGLVALADRCAPLSAAELSGGKKPLRWSTTPGVGLPLVAVASGAVWTTGRRGDEGRLRFEAQQPDTTSSDDLLQDLKNLLGSDARDLDAVAARIRLELEPRTPIRLVPLNGRPATFHVPAPLDVCLRMVPDPDAIQIEIEPLLPPERAAHALAHAAAHLRCGHLRPGDTHGHWDTWDSISCPTPSRRWDRDVRDAHPEWAVPGALKRASLAECTPLEKSWLVLLDHIGRMVGEARTLHPAATQYQAAVYQRQAAQRLVAQLEDYGGAMLCDGVGLGKTYVATTVLVHYANAWRDRLAQAGRSPADDPFRITILSPNSVASTWRREALAPLAAHGVLSSTVRVISHTKLSRILPSNEILDRVEGQPSDMEHLLLSDLVVVDEAHNFRSTAARRTLVLRDLLRLQPRKDLRRKVLLLTATPVNNSLEDLRQQTSLLFCKPLWFNDNLTADGYRGRVFKDVAERIDKARRAKAGDMAPILVHGNPEARFSFALEFRDDVQFGVQVPRVGDYLKEQEKRLTARQLATTAAMKAHRPVPQDSGRIAADLLDRIVVQRSRALCKQIESEQGSDVKLLFRPDAPPPERLVYEDIYDDTHDVLARFLPLFETGEKAKQASGPPLSLRVYMWADIRDGIRAPDDVSSVVGLQRILVLKRLESSPVAFLITLLRLLALHAHRLKKLSDMCHDLGDRTRAEEVDAEVVAVLDALDPVGRDHIDLLLTGDVSPVRSRHLLTRWSHAHKAARPATDSDDPSSPQLDLFAKEDEETATRREALDRLWGLKEDLVQDFRTLLRTAPGLANTVFGRFDSEDWPKHFIAGGEAVDWPRSATWGLRVVTDAKLRRLVARLLRARADGQKVIVFSQFTDTLAYVDSVLQATGTFERHDWMLCLQSLGAEAQQRASEADVRDLVGRSAVVSGETEDRDLVIHAFAPFYRLGPYRPSPAGATPSEQAPLVDLWRQGWTRAMRKPVDILFATDVLAEGVNLQDAAQLVNYDVHWNPVRMIQRSGRIDRRLNPAIEEAPSFPDVEALAAELGLPSPRYWWRDRPKAAPITVNLLLPDELETELQLRERIANKTLAIDFTLGLEQGTGAEAEWMAEYRYQGISALNAWQGDRAIERVAGYQERLRRMLAERSIDPTWVGQWNGWLREQGANEEAPILGWARLGRKGGDLGDFTRRITPCFKDGAPHWLWTTVKPGESLLNFWLVVDGQRFPASTRTDLGWSETASRPVCADDLLGATVCLAETPVELVELGREIGRPVLQGAPAISAGFHGGEADRRAIQVRGFRFLQLKSLAEPKQKQKQKQASEPRDDVPAKPI